MFLPTCNNLIRCRFYSLRRKKQENFALPWNRGHSGDDNLNEVFAWINNVVISVEKR